MHKTIKTIGQSIIVAAAASAPLPALALSCMAPDPTQTITWMTERDTEFAVIYGTLIFPGDFGYVVRDGTETQAEINNKKAAAVVATNLATGEPYDGIIMMERSCAGPWCGGAEMGEDLLMFIENPHTDPVLRPGPCGGSLFANTDKATLTAVKARLDEIR